MPATAAVRPEASVSDPAPVAPARSEQPAPEASHRRHWYVYWIVGLPSQVPRSTVSVWPSAGVPEIDGAELLTGLSATTGTVATDTAEDDPATLVPVTFTTMAWPMSPEGSA